MASCTSIVDNEIPIELSEIKTSEICLSELNDFEPICNTRGGGMICR